jgi:hypothetical protein
MEGADREVGALLSFIPRMARGALPVNETFSLLD